MSCAIRFILYFLTVSGLTACSSLPDRHKLEQPKYLPHYLFVDRDGYAKKADGAGMSKAGLKDYLHTYFFKDIDQHLKMLRSKCDAGDCRPMRLLIYLHGGMNGYKAGFERMERLLHDDAPGAVPKGILNQAHSFYYPFFINWNSEPIDSMIDDLFNIRFGERQGPIITLPTMPFVLLGRLAGSLGGLPVSLAAMGSNIQEAFAGAVEQGDGIGCAIGDVIAYAPVFPLYAVTAPLVEGFGTPAWAIMKRRAELAVGSRLPEGSPASEGAVRTFFEETIRYVESIQQQDRDANRGKPAIPVRLTLVGHSMGTMILNRLLPAVETMLPPPETDQVSLQHIVYLAAAAPIDELDQMLVPFLREQALKAPLLTDKQKTHFWIFNLNRRDEAREVAKDGWIFFAPRGTLLAWIDTFFEPSTTVGQRTQGRIENLNIFYRCDLTANGVNQTGCPPSDGSTPLAPSARGEAPFSGFIERTLLSTGPFPQTQVRLFETSRKLGHNNAPETHGDFSESRYLGQALCQVDNDALHPDICNHPYTLTGFDPPLRREDNRRICGIKMPFKRPDYDAYK